MNYLESMITHIRKKVKGFVYTHRDLSKLLKKEMRKNGHDYVTIAKKYSIDIEKVKAMCSGKYYYNFKWYQIISDYIGLSIDELVKIRNTMFFKRWKKKCNIKV